MVKQKFVSFSDEAGKRLKLFVIIWAIYFGIFCTLVVTRAMSYYSFIGAFIVALLPTAITYLVVVAIMKVRK